MAEHPAQPVPVEHETAAPLVEPEPAPTAAETVAETTEAAPALEADPAVHRYSLSRDPTN